MNDYIAGSIGGAAGVFAGHPFDTVKVQIQTQEFGGRYANLVDVFRTVKKQSLAKGFYRGLSWPLLSYGATNAVFFGCYGLSLKQFDYNDDPTKPPMYVAIGLASAVATIPSMVLWTPVEVIKTTLQSQIPHRDGASCSRQQFYKGPLEATKDIFRTAGVGGMYRGLLTHTLRDMPANMVYMVLYSWFGFQCKQLLPSIPTPLVNFVGGGIAGVVSWSLIMPFDVVKSKLQADASKKMYKGLWDCARRVYVAEGLRGFFMGYVAVALRAFPVNAITLMCYTESLEYLNKQ